MVDGLVAIPIDQDDIAFTGNGIPNDAVRSGRAIGDVEDLIRDK